MATTSIEKVTELSCSCIVMAVCVSTHCRLTCFVLCALSSELYFMHILPQYKTTKHGTICLPYLYSGKGREQAHYRGQNLLPDANQTCRLVSVPLRCRHEATPKGQYQWAFQAPCLSSPENSKASLFRLYYVYGRLCPHLSTLEASLLF